MSNIKLNVNPYGIKLTEDQLNAYNKIKDWYINRRSNVFTLSGNAGTGKTFLVNYLFKSLLKSAKKTVVAPTHKAVRVIEKYTDVKGFTWHSIHGLRPTFDIDDFRIDQLQFATIGMSKFGDFDVIVADESSMLSKSMKKLNDINTLRYNNRIIYLGDTLQLLPVKENKISSVFDNPYSYNLTEIVRQNKDNELIPLLDTLRIDVTNQSSLFMQYLAKNRVALNNNNHGYVVLNATDFAKVLEVNFMSDEFKVHPNTCRIGCYSNERVSLWNRYIRNMLIKSKDIVSKGDVLMGYKTIVDEFLNPVIINSNDYYVVDVAKREFEDGFDGFIVRLEDIDTKFECEVVIVDHTSINFHKFIDKLTDLHNNALIADNLSRAGSWIKYYNYKDTFLTMVDFTLHTNSTKESYVKKEIDYGYATTIHKLQGSTINTMFVDAMNICYYNVEDSNKYILRTNTANNPYAIDTRNRLLYTGLSRTSEKAIILLY